MNEKEDAGMLPLPVAARPQKHRSQLLRVLALLVSMVLFVRQALIWQGASDVTPNIAFCRQQWPLPPPAVPELDDAVAQFATPEYRNISADLLAGAVQIPSISYDDLGPIDTDPRWDVFYDFAKYLKEKFPLVHSTLDLEKVNTHGLLYTWTGTDPTLKPVVFMAHQDAVPVPDATLDQWTHPPFSGYNDGTFIWGRGASDTKNTLIAIFEAVEALLRTGYAPSRTYILSFGFDEENVAGGEGSYPLANRIEEKFGNGSIALLVDEGSGFQKMYGQIFAMPATAEKGHINVHSQLNTPGGHSSIPPPHTSIGIMAEFAKLLEAEPYNTKLTEENPIYTLAQCLAVHAPETPKTLKLGVFLRNLSVISSFFSSLSRASKFLMTTTAAIDLVNGGVKINALPEQVSMSSNHRVALHETLDTVRDKYISVAQVLAEKHNLTVEAFGNVVVNTSTSDLNRVLSITSDGEIPVAPISPIERGVPEWDLLSGSIRYVFPNVTVSPFMTTGNTDTKAYHNLTANIYRFGPVGYFEGITEMTGIHTINERAPIDGHVNAVRFYFDFVRIIDAWGPRLGAK